VRVMGPNRRAARGPAFTSTQMQSIQERIGTGRLSPGEVAAAKRHLYKSNRLFGDKFEPVPNQSWPKDSDGTKGFDGNGRRLRVWRNKDFLVQEFDELRAGGFVRRISVNRTMLDDRGSWVDGITWDQLQMIKNEIGYGTAWAIEIFPPFDQVVNVANMRHLWIVDKRPDVAWAK
jgi:hypothetical protein